TTRPKTATRTVTTTTTAAPSRPPPVALSISTPWLWLSTPPAGGVGDGGYEAELGIDGATAPTGTASGSRVRSLSSKLSAFFGVGRSGPDVSAWQEDCFVVAELEALAEALELPSLSAASSAGVQGTHAPPAAAFPSRRSLLFGVSHDDGFYGGSGMVQLDLAAVQALQSALQSGGFLSREDASSYLSSSGSIFPDPYASSSSAASSDVGGGAAGSAESRGQGEEQARDAASNGSGSSGGGYYSYAPGGGVMAYYDDGYDSDGRPRRIQTLLPAPPVGRHEAALVWKLFRLSRDVTALRVYRGEARIASPLEDPLQLRSFPALQALRLEGIPLGHIQGLFELRQQLKSLSFEDSLLPSLVALLAPPPHSAPGPSVLGAPGAAAPDNGVQSQGQQSSKKLSGEATATAAAAAAGVGGVGSFAHSRSPFSSVEREEQVDHQRGSGGGGIEGGGAGAPSTSTAGHTDKEGRGGDERRGGSFRLDGLQSDLGRGTPVLHWPLLESLSVRRCGLLELDASLRLLPRVRRLSLAHNRLSQVDFLQDCGSLEELDLSHNRLKSVEKINAVVGNLRSLNLRGNLISKTEGLEKVFSLEDVDLSVNRIRDLQEAARLSTLPLLRRVWLKRNPLEAEEGDDYRMSVLTLLYQGRAVELDSVAARASGGLRSGGGANGRRDEGRRSAGGSGVALDGRLPSKKEQGQLSQRCFTRAAVEEPRELYFGSVSDDDRRGATLGRALRGRVGTAANRVARAGGGLSASSSSAAVAVPRTSTSVPPASPAIAAAAAAAASTGAGDERTSWQPFSSEGSPLSAPPPSLRKSLGTSPLDSALPPSSRRRPASRRGRAADSGAVSKDSKA
ncbi:unnamed protein product, partial [Scytosiphon promiscuus]